MGETLTREAFDRAVAALQGNRDQPFAGGLEVQVFTFRIQHRKPRSKKLRIRKKWERNPRNWRAQRRQCFKMAAPFRRTILIISPDMKPEIDQIVLAHRGRHHG